MDKAGRLVTGLVLLGVVLVASGCAPSLVYVIDSGQTTEYTGELITLATDKVTPIDLVACFVPAAVASSSGTAGAAIAGTTLPEREVELWASNARALFTDVRENYLGLDPACDLKLVGHRDLNALEATLGVFAARGGQRPLFRLRAPVGVFMNPVPSFMAAVYHKFANDPKLVATVQAERSLPIAQRPDRPMQPPAVAAATPAIPASDVDAPPDAVKPKPNRYAVVVGIEQYRTKLPKADFAAQDARVMGAYLTKTMGFAEENVAVLVNENATRTDMEKYLEHWLPNRVEKDSTVFIYYSGHGAPNPKTGDAYLVPYDGDPTFVDATGYPLKRLYEQVGKLPAKEVVVLLDSCFSGAGGRSVIGKGMRPMVLSVENPVLAGGKTAVLAASKGDQVSSTYDQKGHGLLTYFFLKGLRGEADANRDGSVDLAEVYDYLKPQVERTARREYNNDQTPQLLGSPGLLAKGVRLVERTGSAKP